jgi:hypothetical protein
MDDEDVLYDIYRDRLIGVPSLIGKNSGICRTAGEV